LNVSGTRKKSFGGGRARKGYKVAIGRMGGKVKKMKFANPGFIQFSVSALFVSNANNYSSSFHCIALSFQAYFWTHARV